MSRKFTSTYFKKFASPHPDARVAAWCLPRADLFNSSRLTGFCKLCYDCSQMYNFAALSLALVHSRVVA